MTNVKKKAKNKNLILWVIGILVAAITVGCLVFFVITNQAKGNLKLKVKETSWSGWSKDYVPEEKEYQYDIELGKKYEVKKRGEEDVLVFTIAEVNTNSVKINTTKSFSDKESGIDLRTDKKEFEIVEGTDLKLTTPTMDAGDIFIFSLVR